MAILEGITVIDFSKWLPGQYCGMLLADYGATVIKVEDLVGDGPRRFFPAKEQGMSYWHLMLNRNKLGLALDIKKPQGAEILRQLLGRADVFLEGFRPGYLARYGLDFERIHQLNPRLVYCSLTGFGQGCHKPAHDLNVTGLAGLNSGDSEGDVCVSNVQVSALGSSLNALSAICMNLFQRERGGQGRHIDVNLYATALSLQTTTVASLWGCQEQGGRGFGRAGHYYDVYRCQDGRYLTVGTIEPKFWLRLCKLLQLPELEGRQLDFAHTEEISRLIAAKVAEKPLAQWLELLGQEEFCVTPVCTLEEALASPLTEQEAMLVEQESDLGRLRYLGPPIKFDGQGGSIRRRAPRLGEHSANILSQLGYNTAAILELRRAEVIG